MFYELLTLSYPFEPKSPYDYSEWQNVHLYSPPKSISKLRSDASPKLSQIILKMIEKEVSVRYTNWEQIESDISNLEISTEIDSAVARIVKKRMEKDEGRLTETLKEEKEKTQREQFEKMVQFKIEKDIMDPLHIIINKFNENYVSGKMRIEKKPNPDTHLFEYFVHLLSGTMLILQIAALHDDGCYRNIEYDDYGKRKHRKEFYRPRLKKRSILAWGSFTSQYTTGFNLVLLENTDTMYGDWFALINTTSPLSGREKRHAEPFVFRLEELPKEIENVEDMHIYNTEVQSLTMEHFVEYIEKYN